MGAGKSSSGAEDSSEGSGKFRRLQMKWEMLSGKENSSQESSPHSSPVKSWYVTSVDLTLQSLHHLSLVE